MVTLASTVLAGTRPCRELELHLPGPWHTTHFTSFGNPVIAPVLRMRNIRGSSKYGLFSHDKEQERS